MPYKERETERVYYSISEVAGMLKEKQSLLRYWEREFPGILFTSKTTRGHRQYTENDITRLKVLHRLIKEEGFTLEGAKNHFRERMRMENQNEEILKSLEKIRDSLKEIQKELK